MGSLTVLASISIHSFTCHSRVEETSREDSYIVVAQFLYPFKAIVPRQFECNISIKHTNTATATFGDSTKLNTQMFDEVAQTPPSPPGM